MNIKPKPGQIWISLTRPLIRVIVEIVTDDTGQMTLVSFVDQDGRHRIEDIERFKEWAGAFKASPKPLKQLAEGFCHVRDSP